MGIAALKTSRKNRLKCAIIREHPSAAEKGSQPPALLCSVAPSKGRGSRGHSLLPMEGGAPKGRRLDGGSGMKERGEIVSSARLYESTRAPPKKEANPASLHSAAPSKGRGSDGRSLLPMEGGAPKGRRLDGGKRYEREGDCLKCAIIREHRYAHIVKANTRICGKRITTDKAFPAWGRWRAERAG